MLLSLARHHHPPFFRPLCTQKTQRGKNNNDPKVRFHLDGKEALTTDPQKNAGENADWTKTFELKHGGTGPPKLGVSVWDWNKIYKEKEIGTAPTPVQLTCDTAAAPQVFQLKNKGADAGTVSFTITFTPDPKKLEEHRKKEQAAAQAAAPPAAAAPAAAAAAGGGGGGKAPGRPGGRRPSMRGRKHKVAGGGKENAQQQPAVNVTSKDEAGAAAAGGASSAGAAGAENAGLRGTLVVTAIKAQGLKKKSRFTKDDPYLKITVLMGTDEDVGGAETKKTGHCKRTQDPVWDDLPADKKSVSFDYLGYATDNKDSWPPKLHVEVWDAETTSDDIMAQLTRDLDISEVFDKANEKAGKTYGPLDLEKRNTKKKTSVASGTLMIKVKFVEGTPGDDAVSGVTSKDEVAAGAPPAVVAAGAGGAADGRKGSAVSMGDLQVRGTFEIVPDQAAELYNVQYMGKQDPYVKVTLQPWAGKKQIARTKTHEDGAKAPKWEREKHQSVLTVDYPGCEPGSGQVPKLLIEVMDAETLKSDRLIGHATVDVRGLIHDCVGADGKAVPGDEDPDAPNARRFQAWTLAAPIRLTHPKKKKDNGFAGNLAITIHFKPAKPETEEEAAGVAKLPVSKKKRALDKCGNLKVFFLRAEGIENIGGSMVSTQDPVGRASLLKGGADGGAQCTDVAKNQKTSPKWADGGLNGECDLKYMGVVGKDTPRLLIEVYHGKGNADNGTLKKRCGYVEISATKYVQAVKPEPKEGDEEPAAEEGGALTFGGTNWFPFGVEELTLTNRKGDEQGKVWVQICYAATAGVGLGDVGPGTLRVKVGTVTALHSADFFGKADQYVRMYLTPPAKNALGKTAKNHGKVIQERRYVETGIQQNSGKNCRFDEVLKLPCFRYGGSGLGKAQDEQGIVVELMDKDWLTANDVMGTARFDIEDDVLNADAYPVRMTKELRKGNADVGTVELEFTYEFAADRTTSEGEPLPCAGAEMLSSVARSDVGGKLRVFVVEAGGLKDVAKALMGMVSTGAQDPYVRMYWQQPGTKDHQIPDRKMWKRTMCRSDEGTDCVWNQWVNFDIKNTTRSYLGGQLKQTPLRDDRFGRLHLEVMDEQMALQADRSIGATEPILLGPAIAQLDEGFPKWSKVTLMDSKKKEAGWVRLGYEFVEAEPERPLAGVKELGLLEPGTLHLDVRRVDNLPEKDKGQKNSLSVKFELGPNVDKNKKNKDGYAVSLPKLPVKDQMAEWQGTNGRLEFAWKGYESYSAQLLDKPEILEAPMVTVTVTHSPGMVGGWTATTSFPLAAFDRGGVLGVASTAKMNKEQADKHAAGEAAAAAAAGGGGDGDGEEEAASKPHPWILDKTLPLTRANDKTGATIRIAGIFVRDKDKVNERTKEKVTSALKMWEGKEYKATRQHQSGILCIRLLKADGLRKVEDDQDPFVTMSLTPDGDVLKGQTHTDAGTTFDYEPIEEYEMWVDDADTAVVNMKYMDEDQLPSLLDGLAPDYIGCVNMPVVAIARAARERLNEEKRVKKIERRSRAEDKKNRAAADAAAAAAAGKGKAAKPAKEARHAGLHGSGDAAKDDVRHKVSQWYTQHCPKKVMEVDEMLERHPDWTSWAQWEKQLRKTYGLDACQELWYPLHFKEKKDQVFYEGAGQVKLELRFVEKASRVPRDIPAELKTKGTLHVKVVKAEGMRDMEGAGMGKNEPYVAVSLQAGPNAALLDPLKAKKDKRLNALGRYAQTSVKENLDDGSKATWNEDLKLQYDQELAREAFRGCSTPRLYIHIMEKDGGMFNGDDFIGYTELPLLPFVSDPNCMFDRTVKVYGMKEEKKGNKLVPGGVLTLKVQFIPDEAYPQGTNQEDGKDRARQPRPFQTHAPVNRQKRQGRIEVVVKRARDLHDAQWSGKMDPVARCKTCPGQKTFETPEAVDMDQDPVWTMAPTGLDTEDANMELLRVSIFQNSKGTTELGTFEASVFEFVQMADKHAAALASGKASADSTEASAKKNRKKKKQTAVETHKAEKVAGEGVPKLTAGEFSETDELDAQGNKKGQKIRTEHDEPVIDAGDEHGDGSEKNTAMDMVEAWFPLYNGGKKRVEGEVLVGVRYIRSEDEGSGWIGRVDPVPGPGTLYVRVVEAWNLGCSDGANPFVELEISTNDESLDAETREAVGGGKTPQWNQTLQMGPFEWTIDHKDPPVMSVAVKAKQFGSDKISAGNFINLAPYIYAPGQLSDFWFPLGGGEASKNRNEGKKGELRLQIQWVPQAPFKGKPKRGISRGFLRRINDTRKEGESTPENPVAQHDGEIYFKIIRARKLASVQRMGKQDPYVRCVLMEGGGCVPKAAAGGGGGGGGDEDGGSVEMVERKLQLTETETNFINDGGVQPAWNQGLAMNFCDLDWPDGSGVTPVVALEVWDKNTKGKTGVVGQVLTGGTGDSFIGRCDIPMLPFQLDGNQVTKNWYPVSHNKKKTGDVLVQTIFIKKGEGFGGASKNENNFLYVACDQCKGLKCSDSAKPYVRIQLESDDIEAETAPAKQGPGNAPVWVGEEGLIQIPFDPVQSKGNPTLRVDVMNDAGMGSMIGQAFIMIPPKCAFPVLQKGEKWSQTGILGGDVGKGDGWYDLGKKKGKADAGKIRCYIKRGPFPGMEPPGPAADGDGNLHITVKGIKNLKGKKGGQVKSAFVELEMTLQNDAITKAMRTLRDAQEDMQASIGEAKTADDEESKDNKAEREVREEAAKNQLKKAQEMVAKEKGAKDKGPVTKRRTMPCKEKTRNPSFGQTLVVPYDAGCALVAKVFSKGWVSQTEHTKSVPQLDFSKMRLEENRCKFVPFPVPLGAAADSGLLDLDVMYVPSFQGDLRVCVYHADNLRNVEWKLAGGKADPYVKIAIAGGRKDDGVVDQWEKTKTINNVEPNTRVEWHEDLTIKFSNRGAMEPQVLQVRVMEANKGSDAIIGMVDIPMLEIVMIKHSDDAGIEKGVRDDDLLYKTYALSDKGRHAECGEVRLGFKYMQAEGNIEAHHQQTKAEANEVELELRALFNELDTDKSGTIEREELEAVLAKEGAVSKEALRRLGIDDPTAEGCAEKLFDDMNEVGADGIKDNVVDFREFCNYLSTIEDRKKQANLKRADKERKERLDQQQKSADDGRAAAEEAARKAQEEQDRLDAERRAAELARRLKAEADKRAREQAERDRLARLKREQEEADRRAAEEAAAAAALAKARKRARRLPLPEDVLLWRTRHVVEWLRYDLDFRNSEGRVLYGEQFLTAAVDGPLLVDLEESDLREYLKVDKPLHARKIYRRAQMLKMASDELRRATEAPGDAHVKRKAKKTHVKRKGKWATQTAAVVREAGALTRVVLEKDREAQAARKKRRAAEKAKRDKFWRFGYDDFDKNVRHREDGEDNWFDEADSVLEEQREQQLTMTEADDPEDLDPEEADYRLAMKGVRSHIGSTLGEEALGDAAGAAQDLRDSMGATLAGSRWGSVHDPGASAEGPLGASRLTGSPQRAPWWMKRGDGRREAPLADARLGANLTRKGQITVAGADATARTAAGAELAWGTGDDELDTWSVPSNEEERKKSSFVNAVVRGRIKHEKDRVLTVPREATGAEIVDVVRNAVHEFGAQLARPLKRGEGTLPNGNPVPHDEPMARFARRREKFILKETHREFNKLQRNAGTKSAKLTRIKFRGGLKVLLAIQLTFDQFDRLFRLVSSPHGEGAGDIGLHEWAAAFGSKKVLRRSRSTGGATAGAGAGAARGPRGAPLSSDEERAVQAALFAVCDTLERTKLTLAKAFDAFDRNGTGAVSVAEFTSLIKTLGGLNLSKRQVYHLMASMDQNFNREITKDEFMDFFLVVWSQRLAELLAEQARAQEVDKQGRTFADNLQRTEGRAPGQTAGGTVRLDKKIRRVRKAMENHFGRDLERLANRDQQGRALPGKSTALMSIMRMKRTTVDDTLIRTSTDGAAIFRDGADSPARGSGSGAARRYASTGSLGSSTASLARHDSWKNRSSAGGSGGSAARALRTSGARGPSGPSGAYGDASRGGKNNLVRMSLEKGAIKHRGPSRNGRAPTVPRGVDPGSSVQFAMEKMGNSYVTVYGASDYYDASNADDRR